jgi:hypothetical protein
MIRSGLLRPDAGSALIGAGPALTDASPARTGLGFALTDAGRTWLEQHLGLDITTAHRGRRPLVRACLDWTERRPHLAGALGGSLGRHAIERGWLVRIDGSRALRVTPAGLVGFHELLDIDTTDIDALG